MCLSPRHQVLQSLLLKEPGVLEGSCREAVTSCRPARARLFAAGSFHDAAEGGRCADPSRRPLPPHGWLWLSAHTASVRAKRTHCHAWGRTARIAGKTRFLGVCLRASLGEVSVRLGRRSKKGHPRPPGWVSLLDGAGRGGEENSCSPVGRSHPCAPALLSSTPGSLACGLRRDLHHWLPRSSGLRVGLDLPPACLGLQLPHGTRWGFSAPHSLVGANSYFTYP